MYQNLELHLDALEDLKRFLVEFQEELQRQSQWYHDKTFGLREAGLPIQVADYYDIECCTANRELIKRIVNNIEEIDLPYVQREIQYKIEEIERNRRH